MDIRPLLLGAAIALTLFGSFELDRAIGAPATEGPQAVEPSVVLSGSYSCAYTITSYYVGPIGEEPTLETYAETADSLTLSTTGGNVPASPTGPGTPIKGPGIGPGSPLDRATPVSGFGAAHSFNDGSIEDCVRFAQTMSATARGLRCTTSDVRRRQPPMPAFGGSASASFNLICEGPQAEIIHGMGELSRAVLMLKLQSTP